MRPLAKAKAKRSSPSVVPYLISYPDGTTSAMSEEQYENAKGSGQLPRGTMVNHPGGWYVVGTSE